MSKLFLSSNAQDFIEDLPRIPFTVPQNPFLSSNAQDFIEEFRRIGLNTCLSTPFLSSNAQDFIEDGSPSNNPAVPTHS